MRAHSAPPLGSYLDFIRSQVPKPPNPPATEAGWSARLAAVAEGLKTSFGRMPEADCDLDPEVLGTLQRDGYAIDRLTFQTRPGLRLTASLYRPDPAPAGRMPAVLHVHGHWAGARLDPVVQSRCVGLVKLGYLCLAIDAFGAGERAVDPVPGAYHGGLVGASLWPTGLSLMGVQVYENRRAVDYLCARSDVDPRKIAITGCSGGGNQTLYAGATDPRLAAVVPVCSIGTYASYLGAACCVCEVNVGGLTYATTGDVLALIAPRPLLVMNASQDVIQFSPGEASKSVDYARERYRVLGSPEKIRRLVFDSKHDYNRPMREALYGWLDLWLRGKGDGSPVAEPELVIERAEDLRCYPVGASRPKTIVTIAQLALSEGRARLAALPPTADHRQRWEADVTRMRFALHRTLRISPKFPEMHDVMKEDVAVPDPKAPIPLKMEPEPGISLEGMLYTPKDSRWIGKALLLRFEGMAPADDADVLKLLAAGWCVLTVDLRATGRNKPASSPVRGVVDHDASEWGLWIGRPLLGQWVLDVMGWIGTLTDIAVPAAKNPEQAGEARVLNNAVIGVGPFGLVGLIASAISSTDIRYVGLLGGLTSLVGEGPWSGIPMGMLAPGLLEIGDIGHLATMIAPRRLAIAGGVEPDGKAATKERLDSVFGPARSIYRMLDASDRFIVDESRDLGSILAAWR